VLAVLTYGVASLLSILAGALIVYVVVANYREREVRDRRWVVASLPALVPLFVGCWLAFWFLTAIMWWLTSLF
jgi:hypothetical protein